MTNLHRFIAAATIILFCARLSGQSPAPFQTLQFTVQIVEPAHVQSLHGYWDPERGLQAQIMTPFYWGEVYAGGQIKSFSGTDSSLPNFEILYLFLGWGLSLPLPFRVRLHTGFNLGINRMVFDHLTGFARTESEVGLILLLELSRPLTPNLALRSSIGRQTIFTYERIHLLQYTAGLSYTIQTPQLIKELLE